MVIKVLAKNAGLSAISHALGRGSLIVVSMILARSFDENQFSAYGYFQLTVSMISAYAALGMGVTASRFFAESERDFSKDVAPIGTLWVLSIVAGFAIAIFTMVLPSGWLKGGTEIPRWIISLGILALALEVVPRGGIIGLEEYGKSVVVSAVAAIILISGALYASNIGSPTHAMFFFIFASLARSFGSAVVIVKSLGLMTILETVKFKKKDALKVLNFSGPMIGVSLLSASGPWLVGRLILSSSSGSEGFSVYVIAIQWFSLALFLPGMVSRVLLPRLVRNRAADKNNNKNGKEVVVQGASLSIVLAIVISVVGVALMPWALPFYGDGYSEYKWVICAFLIAAIPLAPANAMGNAMVANDGQKTWLTLTFIWFVILVVVSISFIEIGVISAAIAQGSAALLLSLLAASVLRHRGLI